MDAKVYTKDGSESGKVSLPTEVFGEAWNADLVHEVVVSMQSNARAGTAHTKDRSEVAVVVVKKPWATERYRTRSSRFSSITNLEWEVESPSAHESEKDYSKKINKVARRKALAATLSKKFADGEVVFVDTLPFEAPKASDAKAVMTALGTIKGVEGIATKKNNAALVLLPKRDENVEKSFRNFGNVTVEQAKDVNPVELLSYKYVVVAEPKDVIEVFEGRVAPKVAADSKIA